MRKFAWFGAVALVLLLSGTSRAQNRRNFFNFFFGADPRDVVNVPIDTSMSNVPIASPIQRKSSFKLLDYFPSFDLIFPSRPTIGQSVFPTEGQMPGPDYLKAFRIRRTGFSLFGGQ